MSSKIICSFPKVFNLNRSFLNLNRFICKERSVLPIRCFEDNSIRWFSDLTDLEGGEGKDGDAKVAMLVEDCTLVVALELHAQSPACHSQDVPCALTTHMHVEPERIVGAADWTQVSSCHHSHRKQESPRHGVNYTVSLHTSTKKRTESTNN